MEVSEPFPVGEATQRGEDLLNPQTESNEGQEVLCPFPGCDQIVEVEHLGINNSLAHVCTTWFPRHAAYSQHRRRARLLLNNGDFAGAVESLKLAVVEGEGHLLVLL